MKILFLDVDGVLNNEKLFLDIRRRLYDARELGEPIPPADEIHWPLGHLHPELVARLNPIVEQTGCRIVLSSSWRNVCELSHLMAWLKLKGFKYTEAFLDRTGNGGTRGAEIAEWLENNRALKVTSYAILDDCVGDIIELHPKNTVQTDMDLGLTDADVKKTISILNS